MPGTSGFRNCACGCAKDVAESTERRHLEGLGSVGIAANRLLLRQQLQGVEEELVSPGNTQAGSSSQVSAKQRSVGRASQLQYVKSSQTSKPTAAANSWIDQAGDIHRPSSPIASVHEPIQNKEDTYGLSGPRRSRRIARRVETVLQQWNQASSDDREDTRPEEDARFLQGEAADDDPFSSDGGDSDDGSDDLQEFSPAEHGQEGIALWDLLGQGFLQEASTIGINYISSFCHNLIFLQKTR